MKIYNIATMTEEEVEAHGEERLDLNELLMANHPAAFLVKVEGDSMVDAGIMPGSILVVNFAAVPENNKIVVASLNDKFTVKRLKKNGNVISLEAANPQYQEFPVAPEMDFQVWGVVTYAITPL